MIDIVANARQFAAGIALGGEVENMAVGHIRNLCNTVVTADEVLLDVWYQFSYAASGKRHCGGLSTLEDVQCYLCERGIIDESGNVPAKEADHA